MMLQVPSCGSLVTAYSLAILILVLHTVDTIIQFCTRQKRLNGLPTRVSILVVILFVDVALISFIEVDKSEEGTRWVPAMWILIHFSIFLELSLEAMFFLRICSNFKIEMSSRKLAYILLFFASSIVSIFDILAVVFVFAELDEAVILQVLGFFSAHMFASLFPLYLHGRGGNLLRKLRNRGSWGLLSCSSCSVFAAGTSLGLLGLPGLYPKYLGGSIVMLVSLIPWTILQGYKLTKFDVGHESTESLVIERKHTGDTTELSAIEDKPPLDPLLKERESYQDMNNISKRLLEGMNGIDFKSILIQGRMERIEREQSYVARPIRMRKKVMCCCDCQEKVSFAGDVCCICRHESTDCGECLYWRSPELKTKEQGVEDEKCDNDNRQPQQDEVVDATLSVE